MCANLFSNCFSRISLTIFLKLNSRVALVSWSHSSVFLRWRRERKLVFGKARNSTFLLRYWGWCSSERWRGTRRGTQRVGIFFCYAGWPLHYSKNRSAPWSSKWKDVYPQLACLASVKAPYTMQLVTCNLLHATELHRVYWKCCVLHVAWNCFTWIESWSIPCNMLHGASKDLLEMPPQST